MAKKVEGYIKLQIPAGKGNTGSSSWSCTWTARRKHRRVYKAVQRKDS